PTAEPPPPKPVQEVAALEGREHLRITFPHLDGYRIELPDEHIYLDLERTPPFKIDPGAVPTWVDLQGVVGESERERGDRKTHRAQEVAYALARRILDTELNTPEDKRPWLFPRLVTLCRDWVEQRVQNVDDIGRLANLAEARALAAEQIWNAITRLADRRGRLRPMINRFNPTGSTADVHFHTRKATIPTEKSEISHVTLDGKDGNTWEQLLAAELEINANVAAYAKNDHLGFTIPYVHAGRSHSYIPDFLVRLKQRDEDDAVRTLIIEVSGSQKSPGPTRAKATTARDSWCAAVNNHGGFGRWGYTEMTNPLEFKSRLAEVIRLLYGDGPIIGDPDLLDFDQTNVRSARGA
ncbi:MAG: restriction endonuclease, partial [Actinomycetia bacterium]|nr:restriction endonuclease [Actinomycetes bacterium]